MGTISNLKLRSIIQLIKSQFGLIINLTRLNKPTGIWLLFFPCLFGILLSYKTNSNINIFFTIFLFFVGSVVMRSAGCIINDIADRKFDKEVERTKSRPLANNQINIFVASTILAILLIIGLIILLQFSLLAIILGVVALLLAVIYPLAKRFTNYPQLFLGLAFSFGTLITSAAINNTITLSTIFLYLSCVIWTIIYDTIYAYQDIEDDLKIGVKSSAIKFGDNPYKILYALTILQIIFLIIVGLLSHLSLMYYFLIYIMSIYSLCQVKTCDFKDAQKCLDKFKASTTTGFIIVMALFLG